jgi:UDP-N-acetylglucosamine 4,6-dehydratase
MKIIDLAKAIGPDCSHKVIGIRPGEKIHEILISEDEGRNVIEYNECYVLKQKLSDLSELNGGRRCPEGFKYASDNNKDVISIESLQKVLDQIADDYSIESTRWSMHDVGR